MKFIIILLFSLLISACNGTKSEINVNKEEAKIEKTLKVAFGYKPRSFDPHKHTDSSTLAVTKQIYSNLFSLDENGELVPELVEKYETLPDNSIILTLKKGIFFQDGKEMKAEDVAASLKRNLNIPISKVLVESIKDLQVLDDYRLKIIQSNAPTILLHNFAHSSIAIVKEVPANEEGINIVGTGAYRIKKWGIGEKVELEAFDKFFMGEPKIKNLIFMTIPENSNRLIALETGEIDIAYDISSTDVKGLLKDDKLKLVSKSSLGTDFISINTKKITDKRVRQAIELGVNKEDISTAVFEGMTELAPSLLAPSVFGYDKNVKLKPYDPEKAKELLKEAGYENGLKLELWIYEEPTRMQMAQVIQSNLKEIGIDISIQVLELSSFLQFTANGQHDMLIGLWYVSTGDADYGYYLHSTSAGAVGNRSFFSNEKFDNLLDEARVTSSVEKREKNYGEAQEIISEEVPLFPLDYKVYIIGMNKKVDGFIFNANGNHILYKTDIIEESK
ncbi:ABC transporter substrate-binding protein [uncultured Fusobacterium sp.]|uniref:ABC transporter substrate-binding protein n=1 Tax=uncultured Fusobacterium sp. TaxID=159267 RepID=UPI0025F45BFA|nr:ABC transporter substrate-binding protein [uncultured Fusobacterium sp.]